MKSRTFLALACTWAGLSLPASAFDLLSVLLPRHNVQVVTNSDVYVKDFPAASPKKPVPYLAIATGFRDFGAAIAGIKEPPQKEVLAAVTKTLETRGYRLATNKTPPKVIIAYAWGTLNADRVTPDPSFPPVVANQFQILRFLGGGKLGIPTDASQTFPYADGGLPLGLSLENPRARDFFEMGTDDYYVIVITAYDLDAANQRKAKPLWSTKISCPSLGHSMAEVLPTMLSIAAPHIGQHLAKPLVIDADDHYKPNIEIGEAKVIENDVKDAK